jgi:hypothetical protein
MAAMQKRGDEDVANFLQWVLQLWLPDKPQRSELSARGLAREMDLSSAAIINLRNHGTGVGTVMIAKFASYLGVSRGDVYDMAERFSAGERVVPRRGAVPERVVERNRTGAADRDADQDRYPNLIDVLADLGSAWRDDTKAALRSMALHSPRDLTHDEWKKTGDDIDRAFRREAKTGELAFKPLPERDDTPPGARAKKPKRVPALDRSERPEHERAADRRDRRRGSPRRADNVRRLNAG